MKKNGMAVRAATSVGRTVTVSLLATGFIFGASGFSWADRGRQDVRSEGRYEQRYDDKRGKRSDHPRQTVVRELPRGSRTVVVNRTTYHVHDHRFYTREPSGYVVVRPPVGAVIASLPVGSVNVTIGGVFYSRYNDIYYRPAPQGYVVVAAPILAPAPIQTFGTVIVSTSSLNVRTGPGQHFPVIGQVWQGQTLIVTAYDAGWYYVQSPTGPIGWVMSGYTRTMGAG